MKKRIAILGSTGSIGKTLIEIIKKDKKNFDIILLTADKNYTGHTKNQEREHFFCTKVQYNFRIIWEEQEYQQPPY